MTTLGKTLVFVNLVLALLIGALIVSTYIGRTDWQRAYNDVLKDRDVANQNVTQARAALAARDADLEKANKEVADARTATDKAKADAADEVARSKDQLNLAKATIAQLQNNMTTAQQELNAKKSETDYLKNQVSERDQQLQKANLDRQEFQNSMVDAQISLRKTQEYNERLLAQNESLSKQNQTVVRASANAASSGNGPKLRPPAEDVEGVVKATDAQSGYLTISIGSDAGLSKGDTLEVYRLKPEGTYLGTIEILAVRSDQAVAKPMSRARGAIQVGDRVSSKIVTKR
jgi:hypothetical protein